MQFPRVVLPFIAIVISLSTIKAQQSQPAPVGFRSNEPGSASSLAPDGQRLCLLVNKFESTTLYFYSLPGLAAPDSVKLKGSWAEPQWSGDAQRMVLYGFDDDDYNRKLLLVLDREGRELKRIALPTVGDAQAGLQYEALNFLVDSAGLEAMAVMFSLPETGAENQYELNSMLAKPKAYNYRIAKFDLVKGQATESFITKATYVQAAGSWKGKWLLLQGVQPREYESDFDLYAVDFNAKKLEPLGASSFLHNSSLTSIQVLAGSQVLINVNGAIYRFDENARAFRQFFYRPLSRSKDLKPSIVGGKILVLDEAQRIAENSLWTLDKEGGIQGQTDLGSLLPATIFWSKDTARSISWDGGRITVRAHPLPAPSPAAARHIQVQLPFEATRRLRIHGTPYLVEYNDKEWQVIDLEAQLVTFRRMDPDDYDQRFVHLAGTPWLLRYSGQAAELLRVGSWTQAVEVLPLTHASIGSGNSLYSSSVSLKSMEYNPVTKMISGVFQSDSSYFIAAWKQAPYWRMVQAIRIGAAFPASRGSWGTTKPRPVSRIECLAAVAYEMTENDWQAPAARTTSRVQAYWAQWSQSAALAKEEPFSEYLQKGSIGQGRIFSSFGIKDEYGYFLADLREPSRSVYFAKNKIPALSKYHFVSIPEAWSIHEFDLSDKASFATLVAFDGLMEYNIGSEKSALRKAPERYANLGMGGQYMLEDAGIYLNNTNWLDRNTLRPVRLPASGWSSDSAGFDPVGRRFVVNAKSGRKGYVELQFDKLQLQRTATPAITLTPTLKTNGTVKIFLPEKHYWAHISEAGIGLDTGTRVYNNTVARLFRSELNGKIDFVQQLPGNRQVIIGNCFNGMYECWDLVSEERLFRVVLTDDQNFVLQAPSGFYYATPNAVPQIALQRNARGMPASWLDAGLNRPDKVLAELTDTTNRNTASLFHLYEAASNRKASGALNVPVQGAPILTVAEDAHPRMTEELLSMSCTAVGNVHPVKRLQLFANNVPVWDTILRTPLARIQCAPVIALVPGDNQLVLLATDTAGNSSLPVFRRLVYAPVKTVPSRTWVITVAVNRYADTARRLRYAVKDGRDLMAALRAADPSNTITDSLFDEAVTPEALLALRNKLMQTRVGDKVVLSFSGHGTLDKSYEFYYGTAPMDFADPKKYGFSFAAMEGLLSGIPARRKLLLIDACNSGNVERNSAQPPTSEMAGVSVQSTVPAGAKGIEISTPAGMNNQQVFSQLFSLSSNKSGAEIIAATAGNAYAYESEKWQNGVFTYALLKGLESASELDRDFNSGLSIRELKRFVYPLVLQLSGGKQQPLARFENPNYDWDLVPAAD
jgi:hypothetical protein